MLPESLYYTISCHNYFDAYQTTNVTMLKIQVEQLHTIEK